MKPSPLSQLSSHTLDTVLGHIAEGLLILDHSGQLIYINRLGATLLSIPEIPPLEGSLWQWLPNFQGDSPFYQAFQQAIATQECVELPEFSLTPDQSLGIRYVPIAEGVICYFKALTAHKQAQARLRYYDAREQLLVAIDQRIRQSVDLEEILNTAVLEIRQFLEADRVLIYRTDQTSASTLVAASSNLAWQLADCHQEAVNSAPWFVYAEQDWHQSYQINDINQDDSTQSLPSSELKRLHQLQVQAKLMVPIFQDQRPWGFITVHQCVSPRQWQPLEVFLLKELATQIAISIQQSELYWRTQTLNAELEQQVQQRTQELEQAIAWEAMLKRITDRVRDSLDEKQILQQAVKELALALKVGSCNAALYDLSKQTSTIYYEYAINIPGSQGRVAKMGDYPELYNQLLKNQYFQFCSITPNPVRGRVAMLACPIFDNEGVLGDLWLVNQADQAFSEVEIRFVQQAANQCAIALRQAKLYQAAQAQVAELEELNRLKDEFLSTVSHELKTPMTNMKMAILMLDVASQQLQREMPIEDAEQVQELEQRVSYYLKILRQECEREIQLINDLLDLQRLEANAQTLEFRPLCLKDWLSHRVALFQDRIRDRQQTLSLEIPEDLPPLMTDANSLERILAELLNNACKYTPPGGEISLRVEAIENKVRLQVTNSGVEIPQDQLTRIFEKFYRVPSSDPWKQGGTGLGLALVKGLIQDLSGSITAESCNQTTCFTVDLPLDFTP